MTTTAIPSNVEAEAAILAAVLVRNDIIEPIDDIIEPIDFYRQSNRLIYAAMLELDRSNQSIDLITLVDQLRKTGKLDDAGGVSNVTAIAATAFTTAGAMEYARIIHDASQRRRTLQALDVAVGIVRDGEQPIVDVIDTATSALTSIATAAGNDIPNPAQSTRNWLDGYDRRADGNEPAGLSTGYFDLDNNLHGIKQGELIYIAARPGMGKTALALDLALNFSKIGSPTLFFSLEMDITQIQNRAVSIISGLPGDGIQNPTKPTDKERGKVIAAADKLSHMPLYIDDTPALTLSDIRLRAKRQSVRAGLSCIIIDYLQYIAVKSSKNSTKNDEIGDISRGLKALAKELSIPVICLSQLNRGVESRPDKRPMLSDLRDSGCLEQDGDLVMFLYRDSYYHPDNQTPELTELHIAKHRNGSTGVINLYFDFDRTHFIGLGHGEAIRAAADFGGTKISQSKMPF